MRETSPEEHIPQQSVFSPDPVTEDCYSRILFIYQDLTDSEFEQYLEFLETPIGTKYTKISSDAYDVAFTRASFEFGEKVGELLQSKKGKTEI